MAFLILVTSGYIKHGPLNTTFEWERKINFVPGWKQLSVQTIMCQKRKRRKKIRQNENYRKPKKYTLILLSNEIY